MKEKVLLIVPTLVGHGQERMAVLTAEAINNDYDTTVVVFSSDNMAYQTNVKTISLDLPVENYRIKKLFQVFKRAYKLWRLRKKERPIAVVSYGTSANFANVLSKGFGKTIVSFRGYASLVSKFDFFYTCSRADAIFCISQGMYEQLLKIYPKAQKKLFRIYNGANLHDIMNASIGNTGYNPSKPAFVSMGRLEPIKGFHHLISSFARVCEELPAASLTIVGEGSQRESLNKLIKQLHLDGNVKLLGSHKNPFPYISACDICVQSSINEGFMNVIVEAFACGIPVISTDCQAGPREIMSINQEIILEDSIEYAEYGILVPAFSSDDSVEPQKEELLSEAMIKLAKDENMRAKYVKAAKERMHEFSSEKYKENFCELLERVTER